MFIFSDGFFSSLSVYRLLWIRGRLGGGKTLLAVAVAEELQKRGITLGTIANIPTVLDTPPWRELIPYPSGLLAPRYMIGSCILFDEAWTILDNRRAMSNSRAYGAFARKLESYWIFPSVIPIDKRASFFYVERLTRIKIPIVQDIIKLIGKIIKPLKPFGEELWIYKYGVNLGYTKDEGWFILANPTSYFGKYDTRYVPLDDGDISNIWERTIYELTNGAPEQEEWYKTEYVAIPTDKNSQTDRRDNAKIRTVASQLSFVSGDDREGTDDKLY